MRLVSDSKHQRACGLYVSHPSLSHPFYMYSFETKMQTLLGSPRLSVQLTRSKKGTSKFHPRSQLGHSPGKESLRHSICRCCPGGPTSPNFHLIPRQFLGLASNPRCGGRMTKIANRASARFVLQRASRTNLSCAHVLGVI